MSLAVNCPSHHATFSSVVGLSLLTLLPCNVMNQRENSGDVWDHQHNRFYFSKNTGHKTTDFTVPKTLTKTDKRNLFHTFFNKFFQHLITLPK